MRLGERADIDATDGTRLAENLLCEGERGHDLIVFGGTGGEDAGDGEGAAGDFECVARLLG